MLRLVSTPPRLAEFGLSARRVSFNCDVVGTIIPCEDSLSCHEWDVAEA